MNISTNNTPVRQPIHFDPVNSLPTQMPEQKQLLTPEHVNTISNAITDRKDSYKQDVNDKAHAYLNADLAQSYVESQKNAINAYTRSANGENAFESASDEGTSLTQQYMTLVSAQVQAMEDKISAPSIQPLERNQPSSSEQLAVNVKSINQKQINQYQETQGQPPKSYLELAV